MRIETVAVHAGAEVDPATGAVTPPIHPSTTFEREPDGSFPLGRIAAIARAAGARFVCDNTTATPILSSPFKLGADLIVHATTKYLGGHSDVLGGIVVARERGPLFDRLRTLQTAAGAVPSPFDCWLVLRGIRTLPYRVRAQSR